MTQNMKFKMHVVIQKRKGLKIITTKNIIKYNLFFNIVLFY